jgi:hypothetical protein
MTATPIAETPPLRYRESHTPATGLPRVPVGQVAETSGAAAHEEAIVFLEQVLAEWANESSKRLTRAVLA